jgi:hypothetical protein
MLKRLSGISLVIRLLQPSTYNENLQLLIVVEPRSDASDELVHREVYMSMGNTTHV